MDDNMGKALAWIGVIIGIIGLFAWQVWLGIGAIILGAIALGSPAKSIGWGAIIVGVIDLILAFVI